MVRAVVFDPKKVEKTEEHVLCFRLRASTFNEGGEKLTHMEVLEVVKPFPPELFELAMATLIKDALLRIPDVVIEATQMANAERLLMTKTEGDIC